MSGNDANRDLSELQVSHESAARFESRKIESLDVMNQTIAVEDDVSMPSMAACSRADIGNRLIAANVLQKLKIEKPLPFTKPCVSFLQRDNVGIKLKQDPLDSQGFEFSVRTDALVNIVGRNNKLSCRPVPEFTSPHRDLIIFSGQLRRI